ncbi:H-NS histone family protein [Diaphorobacter ruginosibacter]|uniref:H-NS histone family protein n=1 Tax=Diaphorobacter ruginosibacter TaxID=1715720 RepID=UPI0033424B1A
MTTYKELLAQKQMLDQQIADARKIEAKAALANIHALIAEFGFTAQQVFPWKPAAAKAPAKYRDPVSGSTWSGRGKPPKWIADKDRAAFEIQ